MNIIDIAIQNSHISAKAKMKAAQAKSRTKDKTVRERAKAANIRDHIDRPSAWVATTQKHVRFGPFNPSVPQQKLPMRGILKR